MTINLPTKTLPTDTTLTIALYGKDGSATYITCPELGVGIEITNPTAGETLFENEGRGEVAVKLLTSTMTLSSADASVFITTLVDVCTSGLVPIDVDKLADLKVLEIASISPKKEQTVYYNEATVCLAPGVMSLLDGITLSELADKLAKLFGGDSTVEPIDSDEQPAPTNRILH